MKTVIYSRVSTDKQECEAQTAELLKRYPEAEVVEEIASGAKERPKLEGLLSSLGKGDTLVVAALDRIGRSIRDVLDKMEMIQKKNIILVSIREGLDLTSPIGRFSMTIVAAVAQLERELISERTKLSLKIRKEKGLKLGRPAYLNCWDKIKELKGQGKSNREIARELRISASSVDKYCRKSKRLP
jgi:DNA invertase Pin-like site-specific DNA recombinase